MQNSNPDPKLDLNYAKADFDQFSKTKVEHMDTFQWAGMSTFFAPWTLYIYITFTSKNQNFHPVPPKIMKIRVFCMKFQGASIGNVPGGPKKVKNRVF